MCFDLTLHILCPQGLSHEFGTGTPREAFSFKRRKCRF
jgi:hypothetical protein